jgi:hypothetical protein
VVPRSTPKIKVTYPVADEVAAKVIAKYQNSSCDQLRAQKQQPPAGQQAAIQQKAIQQLKQNPQMREYFLNKVAGPIVNKLFECGMIPQRGRVGPGNFTPSRSQIRT